MQGNYYIYYNIVIIAYACPNNKALDIFVINY